VARAKKENSIDMEKEQVGKLISARVGSVTIDTSIPQSMKDAFARNRTLPYKVEDFEGGSSSESSSEEAVDTTGKL
jgi:phosphoribosylformimino-5-aminoimidazole carboxamide ribonucleotide (ProFAR) isomerase